MIGSLILGATAIFQAKALLLIFLGVLMGIIFGCIPGLTATMGVALMLPVTFGMTPIEGLALLTGIYVGGISGGLISATLLRMPGTPSSMTTTWDAFPLARKGQAGKALGVGIMSSFIGGIISLVILMFLAPLLANVAVKFGPFEYFALSIFALTIIATLSRGSMIKGLLAGGLGMLLGTVGIAPIDGAPRFTFGLEELSAGVALLPTLIGLFAISQVFKDIESIFTKIEIKTEINGFGISIKEFFGQKWNLLRSSLIGTVVGMLPGIGGASANIVSYGQAKSASKHPEKFGTGAIDGIIASETSNNATIGGALIPLLTLGIPGDTVTAMLLGGFMIHGIQPGPLLFQTQPTLVYSIFVGLFMANIFMILMEYLGIRFFMRILTLPKYVLLPVITVLCVVGAYGLNNRMFDVWTLFAFGILGYFLEKIQVPLGPIILGLILGPIAETNLRRGLMFTGGSFTPFLKAPISMGFLILAVISIAVTFYIESGYSLPRFIGKHFSRSADKG